MSMGMSQVSVLLTQAYYPVSLSMLIVFFVSSPGGGNGVSPFTILNSPQVINGVTVAVGTYIKSAFIHDGSIDVAKIADATITSAKIVKVRLRVSISELQKLTRLISEDRL